MKRHNKPIKKTNFRIDEIALVIVVIVLAFLVSVYEKSGDVKKIDAREITEIMMDDHDLSFASKGVIDEDKLIEIQKMDYITLKNQLNVKNDFCMYIEDENDNVILTKGSSKLKGEGIVCKE